jgi:hypothetical protein
MYRRSPLGSPLFWVVAAFVVPEVVKKCKPMAKVVGDALVNAGEAFRRASESECKPAATETAAAPAETTATTTTTEAQEPVGAVEEAPIEFNPSADPAE